MKSFIPIWLLLVGAWISVAVKILMATLARQTAQVVGWSLVLAIVLIAVLVLTILEMRATSKRMDELIEKYRRRKR